MEEKKYKILAIDDEPGILELNRDILNELGYEPITTTDPTQGLNIIAEHASDLLMVLCDYQMPEMDGLEVRKKMIEEYKSIPFVILSGFVTKEMLEAALDYRVDKFLDKPCEQEVLGEVIDKVCKDRREYLHEKSVLTSIFISEATELLEELEPLILDLEDQPGAPGEVNSIFRLVHTIKGGSGVLDWPEFTTFMHLYEDLLTRIKDQNIQVTSGVVSSLLRGYDQLNKVIKDLAKEIRNEINLEQWKEAFTSHADTKVKDTGPAKSAARAGTDTKKEEKIRVPTSTLNQFMELSGEITVIRNAVNKLLLAIHKELPGNRNLQLLSEHLDEMHKINGKMQSRITDLRKVPMQNVYRPLPRLIRDINQNLGKDIKLNLTGSDLKVDTSLAQVMNNSLVHIIRNCADHGIESNEERAASGKSPNGTIKIEAKESGEFVFLDISDDGKGINPDVIGSKAMEKGLVTDDDLQRMGRKKILSLILAPGFSTAEAVTEYSGRGVGMDMVQSSVNAIGGRIDIDSESGKGSQFSFRLPIPRSVLIINSLLVSVRSRIFNIPQDNIARLIRLDEEKKKTMLRKAQNTDVLDLEGSLLPLVRLEEVLFTGEGEEPAEVSPEEHGELCIVVVKSETINYGLIVDSIEDAEEIVVKPLARHLNKHKIFSGATFAGDGKVGLILDVDGIAEKTRIADESAAAGDDSAQAEDQTRQTRDYLMFTLDSRGQYATPLQQVFRLEEMRRTEIKSLIEGDGIIYRGVVCPLIYCNQKLGLPDAPPVDSDILNVLMVQDDQNYYGIVIREIQEITSTDRDVIRSLTGMPFTIGTIEIKEKVVTILDLEDMAGISRPEPEREEVVTPPADQNDDLQKAAGWGIF